MSKGWINAQIGFAAGSVAYFVTLGIIYVREFYQPKDSSGEAVDRVAEPFWHDVVSEANLDNGVQALILHLSALLAAALFFLANRPFREDPPSGAKSRSASAWIFGSFAVLDFWFSTSNLAPRLVPW